MCTAPTPRRSERTGTCPRTTRCGSGECQVHGGLTSPGPRTIPATAHTEHDAGCRVHPDALPCRRTDHPARSEEVGSHARPPDRPPARCQLLHRRGMGRRTHACTTRRPGRGRLGPPRRPRRRPCRTVAPTHDDDRAGARCRHGRCCRAARAGQGAKDEWSPAGRTHTPGGHERDAERTLVPPHCRRRQVRTGRAARAALACRFDAGCGTARSGRPRGPPRHGMARRARQARTCGCTQHRLGVSARHLRQVLAMSVGTAPAPPTGSLRA